MFIAGVDEAGRGPLAGPVVAAAVILDPDHPIEGVADSKKLSKKKRAFLYDCIQDQAISVGVGLASVAEIDQLNILEASMLAMSRAVDHMGVRPDSVQVDGNRCPNIPYPVEAIVGGDGSVAAIGAASIIAKVWRDRHMAGLAALYPEYGFDQHSGYPTRAHLAALSQYGPTPVHRRSYAPVAAVLSEAKN